MAMAHLMATDHWRPKRKPISSDSKSNHREIASERQAHRVLYSHSGTMPFTQAAQSMANGAFLPTDSTKDDSQ